MTPEHWTRLAAQLDDHRRTLIVHPDDEQRARAYLQQRPFGVLTPRLQASDIVDPGQQMLLPSKAYLRDLLKPREAPPAEKVRLPFPTWQFDPRMFTRYVGSN